jgi:hypothetical protein
MEKAYQYREHGRECRALASLMPEPENRQQLLHMAESWEQLADERERTERLVDVEPGPTH